MVSLSTQRRNEKFRKALNLHNSGDLVGAQKGYVDILAKDPTDVQALHHVGILNLQLGDPNLAIAFFDQALLCAPESAQILVHRGVAWNSLGRKDLALENFNAALVAAPNDLDAQFQRADVLFDLGALAEAVEGFSRVLDAAPQHLPARHNRGIAAHHLGRFEEALKDFDEVLALAPGDIEAQVAKGAALRRLGRSEEALIALQSAIKLSDKHAGAYSNMGNVLQDLRRHDEAVLALDQAILLNPRNPDALSNRGVALTELGRFEEALESYRLALNLDPGAADIYSNRGLTYRAMRLDEKALTDFETAITLNPDFAEAHSNRGNALQELKLLELAIESYDKAIALRPDYADAFFNRGNALQGLKQPAAAKEAYARALQIDPAYEYLAGIFLLSKMTLAEWDGVQAGVSEMEAAVLKGRRASPPFPVLALTDSPAVQKAAAETWVRNRFPKRDQLGPLEPWPPHQKLKIGYFSADFHNHATTYLMAELFEAHDRDQFELVGFSFGPDKNDEMRRRTSMAFDQFIDVRSLSDAEIASLARSMEIDIAVDLKGFTENARLGVFAHGCAPIQVNYLGNPSTLGAPYIDYIIADHTLIPPESRDFYTEKVVCLPHSYQVNDSTRKISDRVFTRSELGLPEEGFVFCCFNNGYKITPQMFDIWMRLLNDIDGSVLWLLSDLPEAMANLRREAEMRGVSADRLVFAGRIPLPEHLARHTAADLFLDTLPCNAHTTTSDALWAGLPVLTCLGQGFAGRVAGSLLRAMDLDELVTTTLEDYEAVARRLATHRSDLMALKTKLAGARTTSPLFKASVFARHIEAAFLNMDQRRRAGLAPDHFDIPA